MKSKLTPSQSQRLIELGVDPSKASGEKVFVDIHPEVLKGNAEYAKPWGYIPTFNLSDILSLLPKEMYSAERDIFYRLNIEMGKFSSSVGYKHYGYPRNFGPTKTAPELIDALFELLCWTLTRNKNEKSE